MARLFVQAGSPSVQVSSPSAQAKAAAAQAGGRNWNRRKYLSCPTIGVALENYSGWPGESTAMCTTSFHPPLARAPEFYIRYAHPISPDCHQLYIVIVAKPYAWLQKPCFCSIVIFVNIVRFPPLRYCQISSAIAETALYSRFGGGIGQRGGVC